MKLKIEQVIAGRLNLQSTVRELDKLGIQLSSANDLQSPTFIKKWVSMKDTQKVVVAHLLGGVMNENKTLKFIENNITQNA